MNPIRVGAYLKHSIPALAHFYHQRCTILLAGTLHTAKHAKSHCTNRRRLSMTSPLYGLAMSAEQELEAMQVETPLSHIFWSPLTYKPGAPSPELDVVPTSGTFKRDSPGSYQVTPLEPKKCSQSTELSQLVTPGGLLFRVAASWKSYPSGMYPSGMYRLHPVAIELIEAVLQKGTNVLRRPIFPHTTESEPLRMFEIRTHLKRRYSVVPPTADLSTLVTVTKQLLNHLGAQLIAIKDLPPGSEVPSPGTPPPSPPDSDTTRHMVSPLKSIRFRRRLKLSPSTSTATATITTSASQTYSHQNSPFLVSPKTTPSLSPVNTVVGRIAVAVDAPAVASPPVTVPSKALLFGKDVRSNNTGKRVATLQAAACDQLRRVIRRWTNEEREVYLQSLLTHGLRSTDVMFQLIPTK